MRPERARGVQVRSKSGRRTAIPGPRRWPGLWWTLLAVLACPAMADDPRDIVFDCPCRAEWTAGPPGEAGELTLTFGVRSFRATESGELRLSEVDLQRGTSSVPDARTESLTPSVGRIPAGTVRSGEQRSMAFGRPGAGEPIGVLLWERVAEVPASVPGGNALRAHAWRRAETLALWPVAVADGARIEFVDMLTDTDGDGTGDVNEALAGTSRTDPAETPGASTIDVLALYNPAFRAAQDGYPYTRIQHVMAVTRAVYRDSGANVRMRMVGASEVALDGSGRPAPQEVTALMESHGADLHFRFHEGFGADGCPPGAGGCGSIGGAARRGYWRGDEIDLAVCTVTYTALCAAHELGHNLGLAHSARQGEAHGAFRWSRGRYVREGWGTLMSYGASVRDGVFSDPSANCEGVPCGVPIDEADGAHAVRSLDLVRFQAAAHRASKPDTDGDGIVDAADGFPDDPADWLDFDGDGLGDHADPDDDNDRVADADDPFPFDATEWEDRDGDGIGDNADLEVTDLSPFRDAALRGAVERALGKPAGAPITEEDLATLFTFTASFEEIRNLTGLDLATNLRELDLSFNEVARLSPLADLTRLSELDVTFNQVSDLTPLQGLVGLRELWLTYNPTSDLVPLRGLHQLELLSIGGPDHVVADVSPLAELTNLRFLNAVNLGITDLSLVSGLAQLSFLSVPDNPVSDLSPLREMPNLRFVDVGGTEVRDLSPLSDHVLASLDISRTRLTLQDVGALPRSRGLSSLRIGGLGIEDLSPVSEFRQLSMLSFDNNRVRDLSPLSDLFGLSFLSLKDNAVSDLGPLSSLAALTILDLTNNHVSDVAPLAGLPGLRLLNLSDNDLSDIAPLAGLSGLWSLDLSDTGVSDIGPLVRREIWDLDAGLALLALFDTPLDATSINEHIPTLESWGVLVFHLRFSFDIPGTPVALADPVLRGLVAQAVAQSRVHVDDPVTRESLGGLTSLQAFNAGVSDLSGLDAARDLADVFLGSNLVSDLTPLAALRKLEGLDLSDNLISDLAPLVDNPNVNAGDWITLTGNPLSEESLNVHVPALRDRGVHVGVDSVRLPVPPDTRAASFDISGYFAATLGPGASAAAASNDPDGPRAEVVDGELRVALSDSTGPGTGPGTLTVTGTNDEGATDTLAFQVSVRQVVALFPAAASPVYQGFVRVINHSPRPGRVVIQATDDEGRRYDAVTLSMDADQVVHFNSQDLEHGNPAKGLSHGIGAGAGDSRLDLGSNLDIEVLGYARTADGFVTALHDLAPATGDDRAIAFLNPGSNRDQVSLLRLVNHGEETAEVTVRAVDDQGVSPGDDVRFAVEPGAARTLTAAELEAGDGGTGSLGDGTGKWRLAVTSTRPVYAMSLLESPTGHLTNLSTGPVSAVAHVHTVPLFPSAADPDGREGFVRVVNLENRAGSVTVTAVDDSGQHHGDVTLALDADATVHFNSGDLERGNPAKGLTGSVGAGSGAWRLALTADVEIDVLGYIRHTDGFLTAMHDTAPASGTRHRIAIFNPGSNRAQVSALRLINPGDAEASVTITGGDDSGASPGGPVHVTVAAQAARTVTAEELETGGADLQGALGDGAGKWRLLVESSEPILAMSLLASPTGHLTNLSTAPMR